MTQMLIKANRFQYSQWVRFTGGEGVVRNFRFESGDWEYFIEMPQGLEPDFGRVGAETIILLNEIELHAVQL
jgi:hypothetical protein